MKAARADKFEAYESNELEIIKPMEEVIPPWRGRLRWWWHELIRPRRLVRLVGPNNRPLERHEFEVLRANYERRVL